MSDIIQFLKQKQSKRQNPYSVKTVSKDVAIKDIDLNKRVVTGVFNSYNFIDSDNDMLIMGSASKSISERGPGTTAGNKIKHLKDHDWSKVIGRIDVLDERSVEIDGKMMQGIYHESYFPDNVESNDMLIKIQEGLYDSRSIGFQYLNLGVAEKDSEDMDRRERWEKYYPQALNPEKADEVGFFWVVKEIKLFEGSDVAFGANRLTPFLGMKSDDDVNKAVADLHKKLDTMTSLLKNGSLSDEGFQQLEMEKTQIKSYITSIIDGKTSIKDTILGRSKKENSDQGGKKKIFLI